MSGQKQLPDYILEALANWLSEDNGSGKGESGFVTNFALVVEIEDRKGPGVAVFSMPGTHINKAQGLLEYGQNHMRIMQARHTGGDDVFG